MKLNTVIDQAIAENHIVGTVVIVSRAGRRVYHRAAGCFDREAAIPMPENAVFRLASLTKPIVSVAALAMVEQGIIGLDDPVTRTIPEFRPALPDGTQPLITIRHLLAHSAGLSYGFANGSPYQLANISNGMDQPGLAMADHLRRIAALPLSYPPGQGWAYSVATDVLGEVLARAACAPLAEIVSRYVTRLLSMTESDFTAASAERLAPAYADGVPRPVRMGETHSVAYDQFTTVFAPGRLFDGASFQSGGAGMVGTADDFLVFLEALRWDGEPVLSRAGVAAMTGNAVGDRAAQDLGPGWGFGLGVAVLENPILAETPQAAGTWQWGGAYGHSWFVDPARELTVIALTNTAAAGMTGAFPLAIRNAVYTGLRDNSF